MPVIEIETPRLILRRWNDADRAPFAALNANPAVMRYFPGVLTSAESDALAVRIDGMMSERGWGLWAVEVKGGASFIGFVGLNTPSTELPCSPCVEIGWRLNSPYWGQGYASEAAHAALYAGFTWIELDEIVSFTALSNQPSRTVMERIGMQEDIHAVFEHPVIPLGHPLRAHCLYRLARADWQPAAAISRYQRN